MKCHLELSSDSITSTQEAGRRCTTTSVPWVTSHAAELLRDDVSSESGKKKRGGGRMIQEHHHVTNERRCHRGEAENHRCNNLTLIRSHWSDHIDQITWVRSLIRSQWSDFIELKEFADATQFKVPDDERSKSLTSISKLYWTHTVLRPITDWHVRVLVSVPHNYILLWLH